VIDSRGSRNSPRFPWRVPRLRAYALLDVRHCAITKLAESEASDQTIRSIAGHLDRKMLEHYSHIRNAAKRKAVEAISSYIHRNPHDLNAPRECSDLN